MSISPEEKLDELGVTAEDAVQAAADDSISENGVSQLCGPVRSRANIFWRILRAHLPTCVEPPKVKFTCCCGGQGEGIRSGQDVAGDTRHGSVGGAKASILQLASSVSESGGCDAGEILIPTCE